MPPAFFFFFLRVEVRFAFQKITLVAHDEHGNMFMNMVTWPPTGNRLGATAEIFQRDGRGLQQWAVGVTSALAFFLEL